MAHLRRVAEWPDLGETKYRLLGELGHGGMSTVYLAEDVMLGRKVALKVVATALSAPEAAQRMLREARILAGLEHPGIVPIHDAGALPDGRAFCAMKRVDGKRLDELAPTLPLPQRLRIFQRICETAAFAHARGVVHRDLKPENVMAGPFGEVLVMDWGVAKVLAEPAGDGSGAPETVPPRAAFSTSEGTIVGTPAYMAPEQADGSVDRTGPRADIFALGAILRFLLRIDPAIPRPLETVARKAMAASPEDRYQSAEALSAEVTRFLDGSRVLAHTEGIGERARRLFVKYRAPILLILAYLVARALLLVFRAP